MREREKGRKRGRKEGRMEGRKEGKEKEKREESFFFRAIELVKKRIFCCSLCACQFMEGSLGKGDSV